MTRRLAPLPLVRMASRVTLWSVAFVLRGWSPVVALARVVALFLFAWGTRPLGAQAQGPAAAAARDPMIALDRNGGVSGAVLPFDQRFLLVNAAPSSLLRVVVWYAESKTLLRAECADLNARERIAGQIAVVVNAALNPITTADTVVRDSVSAALTTTLRAHPSENFDVADRAGIAKAFSETPNVVRLLGVPQRTKLNQAIVNMLNSLRPHTVQRAEWSRVTEPSAADSFALHISPLAVNRDYTFCVESTESLAAADSTAVVGKAAAQLRVKLREHFLKHGATLGVSDTLFRALQRALRNSVIPISDSVVVPGRSLLANEPDRVVLVAAFTDLIGPNQQRCQFASEFNKLASTKPPPTLPANDPARAAAIAAEVAASRAAAIAAANKCDMSVFHVGSNDLPLGWAVRVLAADSGLRRLAYATSRLPRPDTARLAAASATALALSGLFCEGVLCSEAEAIASGQTPLTNPRVPTEANAKIFSRASSSELRPWAENLDSTLSRLRELRDLVNFVSGDTGMERRLGIVGGQLRATRLKIEQTRTAVVRQSTNLRNVMEQLDAMDAAILGVASGVVGRDLKRAGVLRTSSASYETRARWHVGQDIGVLYASRGRDAQEIAPYLGVSLYLAAVNKRGKLPWFCPLDLRCTGFMIGVTTSKFEKEGGYSGVLGGIPLVVGVGTRVGDFARLSYGYPLITRNTYDASGRARRRVDALNAVTLSLDADLRDILGVLGQSLFGK